jgi:hypothetical protein
VNISRTKQVDRNGNVSYRVTRDGVHLGDVVKLASGKHRPESVNGTHGPDGTIKAGVEWLNIYARPTADAISAEIRNVTWWLEVKLPADIHDARTVRPHARRLNSLRASVADLEKARTRLVTELGSAVQEQHR